MFSCHDFAPEGKIWQCTYRSIAAEASGGLVCLIVKRFIHSPWLVALAVLALAVLPVLAALASHREQVRQAESLLFERSTDLVAAQLRLIMSRQMSWQNGLRMRLSNRTDVPEKILDEVFAPDSRMMLPEACRALGYGSLEEDRVMLRWQRARMGGEIAVTGEDLLGIEETAALLHIAMARPAQTASFQSGSIYLIAMTVAKSSPHNPRGWLVTSLDLGAMCEDPQLRIVTTDHTLTARPFDGKLRHGERVEEIGEGEVRWQVALGKGSGFDALFPHLSEYAIALTGGGCALLLALLAGFATRSAGLRSALVSEQDLVQMKDHLLHSVSHEFRTPLSVILSSTELLEVYSDRLSPERRAEALVQIRDSTKRMDDMVGQVLLLSRIEARRMPVVSKPLDLSAFTRELVRETETATHSRCPIQLTAPETLDATLDSGLLRTVLGNLLSNAVKFSPEGKAVDFTVERDVSLRFTIRDHGCGIASGDISQVGEPFFRASSAGEIPGTGLGLAIARKCAELLGGKLLIESDSTGTISTLII